MKWVPNWRKILSQTGGRQKWGNCGSNMKRKLVSAVDTGCLGVSFANDVPNTSGLMQFLCKIRLQSQIWPFLGVRSTNPLSRASGLGKLTNPGPSISKNQMLITNMRLPYCLSKTTRLLMNPGGGGLVPRESWISTSVRFLTRSLNSCPPTDNERK